MPKGDRLAIKAEARPFLRETIRWLRKSRDALLAAISSGTSFYGTGRACIGHSRVLEFFQPYANKYGNGLVTIRGARSTEGGTRKRKILRKARSQWVDATGT